MIRTDACPDDRGGYVARTLASTPSPRVPAFSVECPVCQAADVMLRYVLYSENGAWHAILPEIAEQRCRCLLGDDFAWAALEDHLSDEGGRDER